MTQENIYLLLQKYINRTITPEELEMLRICFYLRSDDDFEVALRDIWEHYEPESLPSEKELKGIYTSICRNHKKSLVAKFTQNYLKIAAILLLPLLLSFFAYFYINGSQSEAEGIKEIVVNVPKGEMSKIILPDGTMVDLNAGTTIKYPENFAGDQRNVELDGQAYFQVAKNPEKPFIIKTNDLRIRVVGTSFDVNSYGEDEFASVCVKTGEVQVNIEKAMVYLTSNEMLRLNKKKGNFEKFEENADNSLLWMKNTLYFNKTPITTVIKQLSRIYDYDIELQKGETFEECLYGEHDNQNIESVLEAIYGSTGIKYKMTGKKIILYK